MQIPINDNISTSLVADLVYQIKVKDAMGKELFTAKPQDKLSDIKSLMKEKSISGVPIVKGKRIIGLVSIHDIFNAIDSDSLDEPALKIMSKKIVMLEYDMPLALAISYFNKFKYGRFPVLNKNKELVGILTSRDILTKIVLELNKKVTALENKISKKQVKKEDLAKITKIYQIKQYDFENAGKPANEIKRILDQNNIKANDVRRVAVAVYELEMNIIVHSLGGSLEVIINDKKAIIRAKDEAPGIKNLDLALKEGFSTANDWIKSLGFGAGMGLPNVKRVSDDFKISSKIGKGTSVEAVIKFK